jgi:hypothetical protein
VEVRATAGPWLAVVARSAVRAATALDALSNLLIDGMAIAEAVTISTGLTQLVKSSVARERPYVHQLSEAQKAHTTQPSNNNTSFFLGTRTSRSHWQWRQAR